MSIRRGNKLTRQQVIRALRRLNAGWPDDLWIWSANGDLHLMENNEDGEHAFDGERVDPAFRVETFSKIDNDGGDW